MATENENNNGNHSHTGLYIAGGAVGVVSLAATGTAILSGRKTRAMVIADMEELKKLRSDMTTNHNDDVLANKELHTAVEKLTTVIATMAKP